MKKIIDVDKFEQKKYISSLLKNVKDFFTALSRQTFSVRVDNQETTLFKEIAQNTRGVKGKLEAIDKSIASKDYSISLPAITSLKDIKLNVDNVKVSNFPAPLKEVKVSNLSDIKIPETKIIDISSLERHLNDLKSSFSEIYSYLPNLKSKEFPKFAFPKEISVKEAEDIIEAYKKGTQILSDDLVALSEVIKTRDSSVPTNDKGEIEVSVNNFPPQHIPTPVTNININSLKGVPKSTLVSIGTSATPLPANPLEYRRSMILFNDSANTIYMGGSDVTTSNGLPVLTQAYSPPIDAGQHMIIYAIAGSTSNVRVFEVSNNQEGN